MIKAIVMQFVLALAFAAPALFAQEMAPDTLLKGVTSEVTDTIKRNRRQQPVCTAGIADLVESKILPLFDFAHMTQMALARNWRLASPEQKKLLVAEFKTLLVHTYASALSGYDDQVIEFKPLRLSPGDVDTTVKTNMKQVGGEKLTLDYEMKKTPAGWKVHNIKVAGVSLITTYRDSFTEIVRERGVDGLIKSLADKNRQSGERPRPHMSIREIAILLLSAAQGIMPGGN
ncbi:MAG: ABC transporter substrate-binding protein [Pseudomonadota bacterium]